jgi:hypothetical protein
MLLLFRSHKYIAVSSSFDPTDGVSIMRTFIDQTFHSVPWSWSDLSIRCPRKFKMEQLVVASRPTANRPTCFPVMRRVRVHSSGLRGPYIEPDADCTDYSLHFPVRVGAQRERSASSWRNFIKNTLNLKRGTSLKSTRVTRSPAPS